VASHYCREAGGGAAITAAGLAKLGFRAGTLGVVGHDGQWLVKRLRQLDVETSGIAYDLQEPTAFSVAVSSPGERSFFTYLGANRRFPSVLHEAATRRLLAHARHVHIASAPDLDSALELVDALALNGCSISLDVGWHEPWLRDPRSMAVVRRIDIFFPNEAEASCMVGRSDVHEILEAYADAGVKAVGLKLGARGAALLWNGSILTGEPHPVEAVVDTTGAGDSFDAGFLYALLRGESPERCLRAGIVCGALSTQALGGIRAFPTAEQLAGALETETLAR
jgi:sugar/nucleoside kinase (ribokinase family)